MIETEIKIKLVLDASDFEKELDRLLEKAGGLNAPIQYTPYVPPIVWVQYPYNNGLTARLG